MNLRIVIQSSYDPKVLAEVYGLDITEMPEVGTTIYVNGEQKYVRQLIKSYEKVPDTTVYTTWFIAEV
ncbi:hypothetical protein MYO4S_00125 [Serratia phage 4S]|nr:hypothetical protein MYO4S_00125 [Serratia phage 4S]